MNTQNAFLLIVKMALLGSAWVCPIMAVALLNDGDVKAAIVLSLVASTEVFAVMVLEVARTFREGRAR